MVIVVVSQEALQALTRPGLDLLTGQLVELAPAEEAVQLDLFDASEEP
ncbi:MAG: hypothetical protein HYZ18_04270 [Pseudogulbenkiania sp.]|nr:hypothetical protein [Pseudogulbenkiania sp.]